MYKFLGIGAQKAGTTWLYENLKKHPDISFPLGKEAHYWNRKYPSLATQSYLSEFIDPTLTEGEITPAYAILREEIIKEIYRHHPDLRIIYIIRNPIDRAWSSAKMALARAEMNFEEASDQWFIDHFNSSGSLMRGDYEACLKKWNNVFPQENILLINFDDIKKTPNFVLSKCSNHLGVTSFNRDFLESIQLRKPVFSSSPEALTPLLRSHLREIYHKKIIKLGFFLNKDLSYWLT